MITTTKSRARGWRASVKRETAPTREPIAWHEAGHALAFALLDLGEIDLVSIVPGVRDGYANEGSMRPRYYSVDVFAPTAKAGRGRQATCSKNVRMLLAGRAAEELLTGQCHRDVIDVTTVPSRWSIDDFAVGDFSAVARYLSVANPDEDPTDDSPDGDHRRRSRILREYVAAVALLAKHRATLQALAADLLAHGTISGADVAATIAKASG